MRLNAYRRSRRDKEWPFNLKCFPEKTIRYKTIYNRPWWPSGLERVSYSSRHSLKDLGSNPRSRAQNYDIDCSEVEIFCRYSNSRAPGDINAHACSFQISPITKTYPKH